MRPPAVDRLARSLSDTGLPHPLLVDAARAAIASGDPDGAREEADRRARSLLQPVVNATGVLLHTNLGRAPFEALHRPVYRNLELDLTTGSRGSRQSSTGALVARACGGEAAMVVNNGAAAVLVVLAALARGRDVTVSRGELVEIGGGFRVPEVMAESGARLVEVGTTNRTRREDYLRAIADDRNDVALVMRVHQSNYRITGFTEQVETARLAGLGAPLVADIGSGLVDSTCPWLTSRPTWLGDEPAARQTLQAGADLVIFSGDKLFGGPQAGLVVGRADLVEACVRHPLARALRPGSLVLSAMQATALAYLRRDGDAIPFWRMATLTVDDLAERARRIVSRSAEESGGAVKAAITDLASVPGGGTLPGVEIASVGVALDGNRAAALRRAHPPVIARVHDGRTLLDLRTVDPVDDDQVIAALAALAQRPGATRAVRKA